MSTLDMWVCACSYCFWLCHYVLLISVEGLLFPEWKWRNSRSLREEKSGEGRREGGEAVVRRYYMREE